MAGLRKGYTGLTHTAKQIADFIGKCDKFCEPFAGLGRVSTYIVARQLILNDMSNYSVNYLKNNFPTALVTQLDFEECIAKYDDYDVTFLFDPPWARKDYADNEKTYCNLGVGEYYARLSDIVKTLKGNWYCAGRVSGGSRSTVSVYFKDYESVILESDRTINGYNIKTKIYYNR